ncbi:AsmA-like C-terminal domain-containing protein [Roseibium sp. HPY-6]|uniref:YhdP family protein n=1 Tax=Roseibium sp. HPY-6 TaxID=3229852 RepID=UPI00338FA6BD
MRKRFRRRIWFASAIILVLAIAGVVALFASGPVPVPFMGSILAAQGTRGPVTLSIERASLDFTAPEGVEVVLEDAVAEIAGPAPVTLSLPKLVVPMDREALLSGKLRFSSLILDSPRIQVTMSGGPAKIPEVGPLMEAIDRTSDVVDDQFARRGLRLVRVRNGSVNLAGKTPRQFEGIDAYIMRTEDRVIRANAKVTGNVSTWRLELVREAEEDEAQKTIGVVVNGITLAELLGPDALNRQGKGLGLPASAKVETSLDKDGNFLSANAVARVRNGWFQLGKTIVAFDDAALSLLFKAGQDTIEVTRSHVIRGNTRIYFSGQIKPDEADTGDWTIGLDADHPQFGSADVKEAPQMLDGVKIRARFNLVKKLISIDRFVARSGKAIAQLVASVEVTQEGPYVAIAAAGENIPIATVKQVWPITLVPPARSWVNDNIKGGTVRTFSYSAAIRPPAFNHRDPDAGWSGNDMVMEMSFTDGAVTPFGELPEVGGLEGTVQVANEVLTVTSRNGVATTLTGGEVTVPESVFEIYDLPQREGKTASISAKVEGDVENLASVANSEPLSVVDRAGLQQGGATGTGSIDVVARFPLAKGIDVEDIDWRATGELVSFSDSNPIMGRTIEDADVQIDANPDQVAITGNGTLDGLSADIDLIVPLGESGVAGKQDVVVSVTARQLKEKGIDLTAFLDGDLVLSVTGVSDGQKFSVDLQKAEIALQALGWRKAKGVPAKATFKLVETEDFQLVRDFNLSLEGATVSGAMRLSDAGELIDASFDTFRLRPGDDADVDIKRTADGRYDIIFSAAAFDGRGLIQSLTSPGGSQGAGDFSEGARIAASIDRVTGFNRQTLQNFTGKIETGRKGLRTADLSGLINGQSDFEFKVSEQGASQIATGQFADTGATLKFLDFYERMEGGRGVLSVAMADEDSWAGDFKVRSLRITEDPAIQSIRERERNNLDPDDPVASKRTSEGTANFDTMDINFTREGDVMTIIRGALQGNVLGGTVSGTVNLTEQTLSLSGTFVPIYALNNFFAKIPILGFALGGNSGEGLIGVTYRLTGSVSDPVLTVNPISAIAPGIFRKMFEFQAN